MASRRKLLFFCIALCSLIRGSTSIRCYYCNSANNSACADLDRYDDEMRSRVIPIVNCDTAVPSPVAMKFFCRKIVQTIFHTNRESELRVTRGCGWIQHHRDCYRADNSDHLETVCQCYHDHCNAAHCPLGRGLLLVPALMMALYYAVGC